MASAVWEMYKKTYARIGLHVKSEMEMLAKYDRWEVCMQDAQPVQFSLFKTTAQGYKTGLSGHDGSSEGKRAAVAQLRSKFKVAKYYGEVSHKVEGIVLASGAPVVCAADAEGVLKKKVVPKPDGLHYTRNLKGIGQVTKIMVGSPIGVTSSTSPSCSVVLAAELCEDDDCDIDAHLACLACDDLDFE